MKLTLSFLFVATGLILCTSLSAQQYHDAVAFGLKGNVKECKVLQENGTYSSGPYEYSKISFDTDGKLEYWMLDFGLDKKDRMAHLSDITRSNGYLTGFNYSLTPDDSKKYRFHYKDGKLICSYILYTEFDDIFGYLGDTTGNLFNEINDDSFVCVYFSVGAVNNAVTTLIEEQYNTGDDLITSLEFCADGLMTSFKSFQTTYKILEKDARGNYTKLLNTETKNVIYQNITYWDDEPASAKPATANPVQAPKPVVTETAPEKADVAKNVEVTKTVEDFRAATPKELSASDILTRPFGVLPTERWRCSMDQILSDLSRYGWKTKIDNEFSFSYTIELDNILDKSGYDLSVLGVVPFSVTARFREGGKELSSMSYSLSSKNHKEAREFCDRLISYLRSAGVDFPEPSKHASEVSAKYGKSIVRIKFPGKGSIVSFLDINYWSYYWSSDGQWVSGWVE